MSFARWAPFEARDTPKIAPGRLPDWPISKRRLGRSNLKYTFFTEKVLIEVAKNVNRGRWC